MAERRVFSADEVDRILALRQRFLGGVPLLAAFHPSVPFDIQVTIPAGEKHGSAVLPLGNGARVLSFNCTYETLAGEVPIAIAHEEPFAVVVTSQPTDADRVVHVRGTIDVGYE